MSKEDKKLKVLKAESDCFGGYGYERTTSDDIGKLVGLNKAS
jgi:AcrR family transcriptional regulator